MAKAEWTQDQANPRFVVTSLKRNAAAARHLYETIYCARGEMENRIKECHLDLFADRTLGSSPRAGVCCDMRANQLRLCFASLAYVLLCALRRMGLAQTQFAVATCATVRLKLLKLGASVRISVRWIKVAMASPLPMARLPRLPPDTKQTPHSQQTLPCNAATAAGLACAEFPECTIDSRPISRRHI